jgi:predicted GNAT family acetyltransferase
MTTSIEHVPSRDRYTIEVDGERVGKALYQEEGTTRLFVHTEIDPGFTGRGLATQLIEFALADTRAAGLEVAATCPMVAAYLEKENR